MNVGNFELFMFHTSVDAKTQTSIVDEKSIYNMQFNTWFIAAMPHSRILSVWLQSWENLNAQTVDTYKKMDGEQLFNVKLRSSYINILKQD